MHDDGRWDNFSALSTSFSAKFDDFEVDSSHYYNEYALLQVVVEMVCKWYSAKHVQIHYENLRII